MNTISDFSKLTVKVYHGFGHRHNLIVYGHVLKNKPIRGRRYTNNILSNIIYLLRLFFVQPVKGVKVQMQWGTQLVSSVTEFDGFFKLEWASVADVPAGWHKINIHALNETGAIAASGNGEIFVPHITQYAFISDIDDTVMISHSSTVFRRLRVLFTKNPKTRKAFVDVVNHYRLLAFAHTTPDVPNPFFYVSSSEWNLYNDLVDFFRHNQLPQGSFLLSQMKKWYQLLKTGKTKHEGKLIRVYRIMTAFPNQKFVLLGDNSQADPVIYDTIARRHPEKIFGVYIRNVVEKNETATMELLSKLESLGIHTCLFKNNLEAIAHSEKVGLLDGPGVVPTML